MRRYNKALFLLIPVISAAIFLTGHIAFASGEQSISESTSIECTGGSCYKVSCINDQCQTFSYNQPSSEQLTGEEQPAEEAPTMRLSDETSDMQPIDDATEQYIEVPVEFCYDGLDNDDDGKVDEECGATTFSSASPNDLIGEEDHKQQSSIDGLEQPSEEYEHNADESEEYESNNEASEEEEHGHED
jgi:cobalamin biosynthesis protein CobT